MEVKTDALRDAYSRKPADELRRIADAADGEYTPEAALVAREVLAGRPAEVEEAEPSVTASPGRGEKWSGIVAALMAAYLAKQVFCVWRAAERNPRAFEESLQRAVGNPWTYVFLALPLVWLCWRRRGAA